MTCVRVRGGAESECTTPQEAREDETHKRDLLNVDTTGEQVGRDEDARRARAELLHDDLALALLHIAVHRCRGRTGTKISDEE